MTWQRTLAAVLLSLLSCVAVAEQNLIYESISGVRIGRVFLSQPDRDRLDAQRLAGPQTAGPDAGAPADATEQPTSAASAGYIIGRNGRSQVWQAGDFVDAVRNPARSMSFPGDVKITRHVSDAGARTQDEKGSARSDDVPEADDD